MRASLITFFGPRGSTVSGLLTFYPHQNVFFRSGFSMLLQSMYGPR